MILQSISNEKRVPEGAKHYFYKKTTSLPGMHRGRNQGAGGATAPQYPNILLQYILRSLQLSKIDI